MLDSIRMTMRCMMRCDVSLYKALNDLGYPSVRKGSASTWRMEYIEADLYSRSLQVARQVICDPH